MGVFLCLEFGLVVGPNDYTNSTSTTHLLFVGLGTACTLKHANNLTVTTP